MNGYRKSPCAGLFLSSFLLFCAFVHSFEYIDGADFYGCHAEILDGGQKTGGKDGSLGFFVIARDDGECGVVLRIECDDAVAEGDFVRAVLRLVEEA